MKAALKRVLCGEDRLLHVGEHLVGGAARLLPTEIRDERRQEWAAELPAILRDPDTWPPARRAARMLRYAAGVLWGTTRSPVSARARVLAIATVVVTLFAASFLMLVPLSIWGAVTSPGDWVHYYAIVVGAGWLVSFGAVMAWRVRRAGRPMDGVRDTVVVYGITSITSLLFSRRLNAAAAELRHQAGPLVAASPPAPAASLPQAVGLARDTVRCFHRARFRPGYQMNDVDEFVARIEALLTRGARAGRLLTAADVEAVKFGTCWNRGYNEETVDRALGYYAAALAKLAPHWPGTKA